LVVGRANSNASQFSDHADRPLTPNHAMVDGNKRPGLAEIIAFYGLTAGA